MSDQHVETCHNREADPVLVPVAECPYCVPFRAGVEAAVEASALLIERPRCRQWTPHEAAWQIRDHLKNGRLEVNA